MIYLRDRKLLFFKPYKTAGTSFEIALSRHAGQQDIVTPLVLGDELLRRKLGGQKPANWAEREIEAAFEAAVAKRSEGDDPDQRLFNPKTSRYFHHMTPNVFAMRAGEQVLQEATVVTMCRHPYEVLISQMFYFQRFRKMKEGVEDLLDRFAERVVTNVDFYHYKRRYLPHFVIRYEALEADLRDFDRAFGLDLSAHLPETKRGLRTDRRSARELLGRKHRELCYRRNRPIFDIFGYEP